MDSQQANGSGSGITSEADNNNSNDGTAYSFPEGVNVPSSVDPSLLQGDIVALLRSMPVDRINAALETFDYQHNLRGDEIRNPRGYLRGILKGGSGSRYGLPGGAIIPSSITPNMLEDNKELIDILKQMSVRDMNSCFRDFDEQVRKKSGSIRNKDAYLLGIIKSGPHFSLPQGVVLPSTLSLAMLQGELLETLQSLPCAHINVAFGEYDEQIQRKGDTIRNKHGYLLGIVKRMKRAFEEEAAEHVAAQQQKNATMSSNNSSSPTPPSPQRKGSSNAKNQQDNAANSSNPRQQPGYDSSHGTTLTMVTESFVKVTNELVVERKARNNLEDQVKLEQTRREESEQRVVKLMADLATEKKKGERAAIEVQRSKKDLAFEKSLRETAEEKAKLFQQAQQQSNPDNNNSLEEDLVKKLELELSIERGLREKTEKLLQTAEHRIHELNRELQYLQQGTTATNAQSSTSSPFGNWLGSQSTTTNDQGSQGDNQKTTDMLVSLSGFDPATFGFNNGTEATKTHAHR